MDRIAEWQVFVALAATRSMVAVARARGRSPQSITRAIGALEARVGTRLFHRTTRSVAITSDGERYLERARRWLAELDQLEGSPTELVGRVSITAPVLFGELHVAPIVRDFIAHHARVDARLVLLDRVVSLADEGIDVGVRVGDLPDSALRARLVGRVRAVVCASPSYLARAGTPRTLDALAKHACIAFTGTTPIPDRWTFAARPRGVALRPRLIANTARAAIDAALAGHGITRVLSYQVDALVTAGKLRLVLATHTSAPIPVHVVQLPGIQARLATAFADFAVPRLTATLA